MACSSQVQTNNILLLRALRESVFLAVVTSEVLRRQDTREQCVDSREVSHLISFKLRTPVEFSADRFLHPAETLGELDRSTSHVPVFQIADCLS